MLAYRKWHSPAGGEKDSFVSSLALSWAKDVAPVGRLLGSLALVRKAVPTFGWFGAVEEAAVFDGSDMMESRRGAWSKENNEGKRASKKEKKKRGNKRRKGLFQRRSWLRTFTFATKDRK